MAIRRTSKHVGGNIYGGSWLNVQWGDKVAKARRFKARQGGSSVRSLLHSGLRKLTKTAKTDCREPDF
jgi:hypothetical protein